MIMTISSLTDILVFYILYHFSQSYSYFLNKLIPDGTSIQLTLIFISSTETPSLCRFIYLIAIYIIYCHRHLFSSENIITNIYMSS